MSIYTQPLRIHHFETLSHANGPGRRAVIWTQGCTLGCPGCFNPQTHAAQLGEDIPIKDLITKIISLGISIEGITISGGEPLQQIIPIRELVHAIHHSTNLSIIIFSGYTFEEITRFSASKELFNNVDVIIAGRYNKKLHVAKGLIGSSNKTFHFFSDRYNPSHFNNIPGAEIIIAPDGTTLVSGISPVIYS